MINRKDAAVVYRKSLGAFAHAAFEVVNPGRKLIENWHIDAICHRLQSMVEGSKDRRLVLCQPPRTMKSFVLSTCLPAWLLGREPSTRIICCSYGQDLSNKFSRDCRALMESRFYRQIFARTRISAKKATEIEFETTRHGFRLASSVGGVLTGRGCDVLIIDDPLKASDAESPSAMEFAAEWLTGTALSRLDDRSRSLIFVTMQRLHVDDLAGTLIEQGWPSLILPAIATEPANYHLGAGDIYHRPAGELLQPQRDRPEDLERIRAEVGSRNFSAQYQQQPAPAEGNLIKAAWFKRYQTLPAKFLRIVLSCDPAGKPGENNDYTAIVVAGIARSQIHILDAVRGHWSIMQMKQHIIDKMGQWKADLALVEDTSSGMGLIQILKEQTGLSVIGRQPKAAKDERFFQQQARFEAGQLLLPVEAPWLSDYEGELLRFPVDRYDDQVDATLQLLEWYSSRRASLENNTCIGLISIRKDPEEINPFSVIGQRPPGL